MLSATQYIVRGIVWSALGANCGWTVGRWIGIVEFGGYFGSTATVLGPAHVVYSGVGAIAGAIAAWFLGTLLNAWPKTRPIWIHVECWFVLLLLGVLLVLICPITLARE